MYPGPQRLEHKCVLEACRRVEQIEGWDVTYLPVGLDGVISTSTFQEAIRPETVFASIMFVNNEIGTKQPVEKIGKICKDRGIFFHVDAAQAVGKVSIDVKQLCVDALSVSAHKLHGPKGIGALAVSMEMEGLIKEYPFKVGGGQERGLRSGTVPVPLAVGFGQAAQLAREHLQLHSAQKRCQELGQKLFHGIQQGHPTICLNGSHEKRIWSNVSVCILDLDGGDLLQRVLPQVSCSNSSACGSAAVCGQSTGSH